MGGGVWWDGVVEAGAVVSDGGRDGDGDGVDGDVDGDGVGVGGAVLVRVAAFRVWLSGVEVASLSDRERVELVAELEAVKGSGCAVQARATDALRCSREVVDARDVARSVGSVVALARRESPSLGDRFVGLSRALVHEMPVTMGARSGGVCGERVAVAVVQATAALSVRDRAEVDRRVGPLLGVLGVRQAGRAAVRVAAEVDAASVVARMEAAVRSRRVMVRPAPQGMAYLSVLGPLKDVVCAYAALQARARAVVGGQCPQEGPGGRGVGAVAADTALRVCSGRQVGQLTPVEVHLVMTDRTLLGSGDPTRSVFEPARIPGHGCVPAPVARAWLREGGQALVWVRRLYTGPGGGDLVAMDSRRRVFGGLLRRMLVLRDDVCTTPWCEAPIVHADHAVPVAHGGVTAFLGGNGKCARCNQTKEAPGWRTRVSFVRTGDDDRSGEVDAPARRVVQVSTPLGHHYYAEPPPLLGWGSQLPSHHGCLPSSTVPGGSGRPSASSTRAPGQEYGPARRRKRPLRRPRTMPHRGAKPRRPRVTSHLERQLCRLLT